MFTPVSCPSRQKCDPGTGSCAASACTGGVCGPVEPSTYTLTAEESGLGWGTVTGPGIDFGSDGTEEYASGTVVMLTAEAGFGASFSSWSGCDSVDGNSYTVTMTGDRVVTATFAMASAITIVDLPSFSSDGNYTLRWTVGGLASSDYSITEAGDATFTNTTSYFVDGGSMSYTFTNKPDGTYWYIVSNVSLGSSASASITVAR